MRILFSLFVMGLPLAISAQTSAKLLPFQGRLTDPSGVALADGTRVVQFKIFNAPKAGDPVWAGELHRASVNGGLVNVILGTKAPLTGVDFNLELYLEVTVDVSGPAGKADDIITGEDPPMFPRQRILAPIFAKEAELARSVAPGSITTQSFGAQQIDRRALALELLDELCPVGSIQAYAGDAESQPPAGWLLCDGRALKAADYPRLWKVLGTRWGNGSTGSNREPTPGNQFNLPDFRGRFLRGRSGSSGLDPDANRRVASRSGGVEGNFVGSVQDDELGHHVHPLPGTRREDYLSGGGVHADDVSNNGFSVKLSTEPAGGAETRPKNAAVNFIIKH